MIGMPRAHAGFMAGRCSRIPENGRRVERGHEGHTPARNAPGHGRLTAGGVWRGTRAKTSQDRQSAVAAFHRVAIRSSGAPEPGRAGASRPGRRGSVRERIGAPASGTGDERSHRRQPTRIARGTTGDRRAGHHRARPFGAGAGLPPETRAVGRETRLHPERARCDPRSAAGKASRKARTAWPAHRGPGR